MFDDARAAAFDEAADPGEPSESNWIVIGDRRYKVFALPSKPQRSPATSATAA